MSSAVLDAPPIVTSTMPACALCAVPLCYTCGLCHSTSCQLNGKRVVSKSQLVELNFMTARTQKAAGYAKLASWVNVPKPFRIIMDEADIEPVLHGLPAIGSKKWFVRPCPIRPRHGFVESRAVSHAMLKDELHTIFHEARQADPQAELLMMPTIDATHNVVLTPARMAIGVGNDGATAGRKSTSFPLIGAPFSELASLNLPDVGVHKDEDPYVEVVIRDAAANCAANFTNSSGYASFTQDIFFTQLRAGVKIPPAVGADFIPQTMVVDAILEASGDLLEWEKQVQQITPGTVVVHQGGTLVSHYGVHCVFNRIPIFTSRVPEIGETIEHTNVPERPAIDAVIDGLALGVGDAIGLMPQWDDVTGHRTTLRCNHAVAMLLASAHNAAAMSGTNGKWLGVATGIMLRLGMAASHGEARHKDIKKIERNSVYALALNNFFESRDTIGYAQWRFKNLSWDSSFGGKAWAKCTDSILALEFAARRLLKDRTDENVTALVNALNETVNQAHNGGWWLNKFVHQTMFDHASIQSMYSLAAAAPAILSVSQLSITDDDRAVIEKWQSLDDPQVVQGAIITKAETKPVGDHEVYDSDVDGDTCGDPDCEECHPKEMIECGDCGQEYEYGCDHNCPQTDCETCGVTYFDHDGHNCPDKQEVEEESPF